VPRLPAALGAGVAALVADLTAMDPAARPASARRVADRAGELLAVPMRASEGNGPASVLLDPEVHGSGPLPDRPGRPAPSTRDTCQPPSSARSRTAAAVIAVSLPNALSRGRYFMPQSGASTIRDAGT